MRCARCDRVAHINDIAWRVVSGRHRPLCLRCRREVARDENTSDWPQQHEDAMSWLDDVRARRAAVTPADDWYVDEGVELWSVSDRFSATLVACEVHHAAADLIAHAPADVDRLLAVADAAADFLAAYDGCQQNRFRLVDRLRQTLHDEPEDGAP